MFSTTNAEQPQAGITPLGVDESTTSTAAQARPLPVFWGTQKLGLTYISNAFNQTWTEQKADTGKSSTVVGYHYFCQFAALVCHGPVDALHQIRYNDKVIWPKDGQPVTRGNADYTDITVEDKYQTSWRIYWGTETQGRDVPPECEPQSCTASASTGLFAAYHHGLETGDEIRLSAATFPGGLNARTRYYAVKNNDDSFAVAATASGAALSFTTNGSGITVRKVHAREHKAPFYLSDLEEPWWDGLPEYHPAYKGQCLIVGRMHALGYNATTFPQIEVIVSRWPSTGMVGNAPVYDYLPTSVVSDCLTNTRWGLGLPSSVIDSTSLGAVATQLGTETFGISPFVDRAAKFSDFLTEILGYFDGYYYGNEAGKIAFGLHRGVPCSAAATSPVWLDETCLAATPSIKIETINTTRNTVQVQFSNQLVAYKDDCCPAHSSGTLAMLGYPSSEALSRPFVTRLALADKMAHAAAKVLALPVITGTLTVRKSRRQGLVIGSPFYLSYALYSLCHLHCVVTAIRVGEPFTPTVEVDFQQDYGYLNGEVYNSPITAPSTPTSTVPPTITEAVLIECPASQYTPESGLPYFFVLASRPFSAAGGKVGGMLVKYLDDPGTSHYTQLAQLTAASQFAARLQLNADVNTVETELSVTVLSAHDGFPDTQDFQAPAAGVLDWLIIWTSDDGSVAEIMGVDGFTLTGADTYSVTVRRGAMDVPGQAISTGQPGLTGWLIRIAALYKYRFEIPLTMAIRDVATVKVAALVGTSVGEDSAELTAEYRARPYRPWKPSAALASWPESWGSSVTSFVFGWVKRFAEAASGEASIYGGPEWVIDIRPSAVDFDILTPETGRVFEQRAFTARDQMTVKTTDLLAAIGTRQDVTVRLYAVEDGMPSLWFDAKEITAI